jgi:hypothetical protein
MPITSAHQVVAQPLSWLWQDRIPLGKLLILDGDPDLGKSLLALDCCARLSTGRPFPDGQPGPGPVNALVLRPRDHVSRNRLVRCFQPAGSGAGRPVGVVGRLSLFSKSFDREPAG